MIYVGLPVGSNYGWGILGKELVLELSRLTDVRIIAPPNLQQNVHDEVDFFQISRLWPNPEQLQRMTGDAWALEAPVIQAVTGRGLDPFVPQVAGPSHVGFAVFEEDILAPKAIERAQRLYRHLATGSTFCTDVLRAHGFTNVSTVLHGVDPSVFHPREEPRTFLRDEFVVFSGAKFALRKGQDVVIRAYKVLQDRHRDVMLINCWYNQWAFSLETMARSRLIRFHAPPNNEYVAWMNSLLAANGLDLDRIITVGLRDNRLLPSLYHASDLGIFPSRVEGGTNMVLMEYLACGKPAIATFHSGHKDIVNSNNAVLIERHNPMPIHDGADLVATWNDPDLDEVIEKLEWCYQNREQLARLGRQAGDDMKRFPWKRVAQRLLDALRQTNG